MAEDEAVKAELPFTFFGEGFCLSAHDPSLEMPFKGYWTRAVQGADYHKGDELEGSDPESSAQRGLGEGCGILFREPVPADWSI
jgi:hypothetical protein